MRILMVNVPFNGHINPTLPLVKELVKRGHEVSYILTNQWKDRIEETGAVFVPYREEADYEIIFRNGKPKNFLHALKAWKYVYHTIMDVGKDYDLLIYEFFTFTAFVAAQRLHLKAVRLFSTFAVSRENIQSILVSKNKQVSLLNNKYFIWIATKLICGNIELATPNILTEITDVPVDLNIVFTAKEFQKDSSSFDERYVFVGPCLEARSSNVIIPFDDMKEKIIYISLGTLQNNHLQFYQKCIAAFQNKSEVSVVMSVGKEINIAELGTIPPNFYIYPFVPQLEVLKKSVLFITHGGMNSVNEGLALKNLLIVIPLDMDQFAIADRVSEMKLGVKLKMDDVTSDTLYELATRILSDCQMIENVEKMSNLLQAAGNVKRATDLIESVGVSFTGDKND